MESWNEKPTRLILNQKGSRLDVLCNVAYQYTLIVLGLYQNDHKITLETLYLWIPLDK